MERLARDAPKEEDVDKAMETLDTDRSGTISVSEYKLFIRKLLESIAGIDQE